VHSFEMTNWVLENTYGRISKQRLRNEFGWYVCLIIPTWLLLLIVYFLCI